MNVVLWVFQENLEPQDTLDQPVKQDQMEYLEKMALLENLACQDYLEKRVKLVLLGLQDLQGREEDLGHLEMVMEKVSLLELLDLEDLLEREDLLALLVLQVNQELLELLEQWPIPSITMILEG